MSVAAPPMPQFDGTYRPLSESKTTTASCDKLGDEVYVEGTLVGLWDPYGSANSHSFGTTGSFNRGAECPSTYPSCLPVCSAQYACCLSLLHEMCAEFAVEVSLDFGDYYSCRGLVLQGLGLGTAAILANTPLDEDFQRWHDTHVRSESSDDLAVAVKWLGEGYITIPICAGAALLSMTSRNTNEPLGIIGEWGGRSLRSFAVGTPSLLAMKYLYILNASRPEDGIGSRWRPFDDPYSEAAASGHAFVGAVPFLTAARLTDNWVLKAGFYTVSALPAWSRINDRKHYLSQALFGWWLAWVAVDVVHRTELYQENFVILPHASPNGFGMRALWRW